MIVVLNFGSQFAHLIARRVRDLGVKAEILSFDASREEILAHEPQGIILSGGPASVLDKGSPRPQKDVFDLGVPILGICYGEQVMAQMLGGKVARGKHREFGKEKVRTLAKRGIFKGLAITETVWFSHGDQVTKLPKDFIRIGSSHDCTNAAIAHRMKPWYGIQFHPEVTHTVHGKKIFKNFLFDVCHAKRDWNMRSVADDLIASLRTQIGRGHVLIAVSGGVDSLVAAALLHKAIGTRAHPVFVDTGLLRTEDRVNIERVRKTQLPNLRIVHAEKLFMSRLRGITDTEEKRKIVGHAFIDVFEREAKRVRRTRLVRYLAQGTIYPDRIESAEPNKAASKIKSHHNLTLPEKLDLEIVEPLRDLYKDEVRRVGELLSLPHEAVWRHPFPGPGFAVRILGEVTKEKVNILREADTIYIEELHRAKEYEKIWQAFAALLPVKSVGVMGDARTYECMISLRAVDSVDGMSADWHRMPPELLDRLASRIIREVRGVNRVVYDITSKPPATIEYE